MALPDRDDVVIQPTRGRAPVYLLGTPSAPDQFKARTRDAAVSHAMAYARHQRVRAWLANADDTFVLLGTFRLSARSPRLTER